MPIYEYQCSRCGRQTEAWQKFSDPPLTRCDHCKGTLKKLISQSTFHLKGTGWYVTDYASKRGQERKAGSTSGDAGSSARDSSKGDGKKETPKKEAAGKAKD